MKATHAIGHLQTLAVIGLATGLFTVSLSARAPQSLDPPKRAGEHQAGPAWVTPPEPEVNRWAGKGIPSRHGFGAQYTRRNYRDEEWHVLSRTGAHSDVLVRFGPAGPEVLFGRVTSHHPQVLVDGRAVAGFDELVPRKGDGPEGRPDKVNRHAHARVIESTAEQAVVHYRYLPQMPETVDRLNPPDQRGFVDEYFVFRPDRSGLRAVRRGTEMVEDWDDASGVEVTAFAIGDEGRIVYKPATATGAVSFLPPKDSWDNP